MAYGFEGVCACIPVQVDQVLTVLVAYGNGMGNGAVQVKDTVGSREACTLGKGYSCYFVCFRWCSQCVTRVEQVDHGEEESEF